MSKILPILSEGSQQRPASNDIIFDRYLEQTLGKILPEAVYNILQTRPVDPIDSIAQALYQATDSQEYRRQRSRYLSGLVTAEKEREKEEREQSDNLKNVKTSINDMHTNMRRAQIDERDALVDILKDRKAEQEEMERLDFLDTVLGPSIMDDWGDHEEEDEWTEERITKRIGELNKQLTKKAKTRPPPLDVNKWKAAAQKMLKKGLQPVPVVKQTLPTNQPESGKLTPAKETSSSEKQMSESSETLLSPREQQRRELERQLEEALEKGNYELTETGAIVYATPSMDRIGLRPKKFRQKERGSKKSKRERPDAWYSRRHHCKSLYEDEIYTRCDYDNFKSVPTDLPSMTLNEFLAPRNTTPEPEPEPEPEHENDQVEYQDKLPAIAEKASRFRKPPTSTRNSSVSSSAPGSRSISQSSQQNEQFPTIAGKGGKTKTNPKKVVGLHGSSSDDSAAALPWQKSTKSKK